MTTPQNARKFLFAYPFVLPCAVNKQSETLITEHSKHVIGQVIDFIDANPQKTGKEIGEYLRGLV